MICQLCGIDFKADDKDPICTECLSKEVSGVRTIMRSSDIPKSEEDSRLLYRLIRSMKEEAGKDQGR